MAFGELNVLDDFGGAFVSSHFHDLSRLFVCKRTAAELGILVLEQSAAQFCEADWQQAVLRNTDAENYMPVPLVGAAALMSRSMAQQNQVTSRLERLKTLEETHTWVQERHQEAAVQLEVAAIVECHAQGGNWPLPQSAPAARGN